jgi:biopolymer transport protein ExbD
MTGRSLPQAEMNATPLIDVLLVLLVMLILTVPIATHAVKLNLPQGEPALPSPPLFVKVYIDHDGQLHWNHEAVADLDALSRRFRTLAGSTHESRVKVLPDSRVRYERVAQVLSAAQRAGVRGLEVFGNE